MHHAGELILGKLGMGAAAVLAVCLLLDSGVAPWLEKRGRPDGASLVRMLCVVAAIVIVIVACCHALLPSE